jgi:hypothetical protein
MSHLTLLPGDNPSRGPVLEKADDSGDMFLQGEGKVDVENLLPGSSLEEG